MKDLHITVKELFPIVLAVEIWGQTLSIHKVLFMTDKSGSCRDYKQNIIKRKRFDEIGS